MAEAPDNESSKPGLGMRLAIASISKRFPLARNVSTHWLDQRLHEGQGSHVKILDCRAENEYDVSHIEGAVRIDYESSPEEILKVAAIDQSSIDPLDVVCYCSVGYRSSLVAQKLQDYVKHTTGSSNNRMSFFNLEGSLFKWANENRHMTNSEGCETKFAHPYNAVFGKLLNSDLRKS
uniref:Uncharacterized protein LOC111118838 isoform X2 n=1 Tax=Crassostrea virginica TaxID=6565 RepID=A0A8B8CEJ9_CRAVI|nr:uncharacterized protein LOC111118838 isoform X2 [Crassostrea virginica]